MKEERRILARFSFGRISGLSGLRRLREELWFQQLLANSANSGPILTHWSPVRRSCAKHTSYAQ